MAGGQGGAQINERDKAIQAYYDELARYEAQGVEHEGAVRSAFQNLLSHYAQQVKWTLVAELSASLAHEIKNPLASIRSAVEQISRMPAVSDDQRTLGTLVLRESDRLSRLLSEFLDFARVRMARTKPVDLAEVARGAAGLAHAHPDREQTVRVACIAPETQPVDLEGDEDLLHRAVFNLVLNAVQASPSGSEVRIEVARGTLDPVPNGLGFDGDAVSLRVTDAGPGIPADVRARMFDPFFTTKANGTGLGLAVVHRAIEAHRGLVLVDSGPHGTKFTVILPRAQQAAGSGSIS